MNKAFLMLHRVGVLVSAGWILWVVSPVADAFWVLAIWLGLRFWPRYAIRFAEFLQMRLVPFLLLDFLAWPLAKDYLRAKRDAETEGSATSRQLIQQQGGMTLQAFATLQGLTKNQALYLANRGRVIGAQKAHDGRWLVFPPAKLSEPLQKRTTWRNRQLEGGAA